MHVDGNEVHADPRAIPQGVTPRNHHGKQNVPVRLFSSGVSQNTRADDLDGSPSSMPRSYGPQRLSKYASHKRLSDRQKTRNSLPYNQEIGYRHPVTLMYWYHLKLPVNNTTRILLGHCRSRSAVLMYRSQGGVDQRQCVRLAHASGRQPSGARTFFMRGRRKC